MSSKTPLTKVIEKAIKGGWEMKGCETFDWKVTGGINPKVVTHRSRQADSRIAYAYLEETKLDVR